MNRILTIPDPPDFYEIYLSGSLIKRIVKYVGDSQFAKECDFDALPQEIQRKIIKKYNEIETNE